MKNVTKKELLHIIDHHIDHINDGLDRLMRVYFCDNKHRFTKEQIEAALCILAKAVGPFYEEIITLEGSKPSEVDRLERIRALANDGPSVFESVDVSIGCACKEEYKYEKD